MWTKSIVEHTEDLLDVAQVINKGKNYIFMLRIKRSMEDDD